MNLFFEERAKRVGNCHTLNTPSLLALRSIGIPTLYPSGRYVGSNAGHAVTYPLDTQLGGTYALDFASVSNRRRKGDFVQQVNNSRPRNLIFFELDRTNLNTYGIKGIAGEPEPVPVSMGTSGCGYITVSEDGKRVSTHFPDAVPGASSVKKISESDPRFVLFDEKGVRFRGNTP